MHLTVLTPGDFSISKTYACTETSVWKSDMQNWQCCCPIFTAKNMASKFTRIEPSWVPNV